MATDVISDDTALNVYLYVFLWEYNTPLSQTIRNKPSEKSALPFLTNM